MKYQSKIITEEDFRSEFKGKTKTYRCLKVQAKSAHAYLRDGKNFICIANVTTKVQGK